MKRSLAVGLAILAGPAHAHAFKSGADLYAQFGEGISVALTDPRLALGPIAVGLSAALAHPRGFPRQWLFLLVGIIGGQLIAASVPPAVMAITLAIAALTALLGLALQFRLLNLAAVLVGAATAAPG